jgi:hypothetical protein
VNRAAPRLGFVVHAKTSAPWACASFRAFGSAPSSSSCRIALALPYSAARHQRSCPAVSLFLATQGCSRRFERIDDRCRGEWRPRDPRRGDLASMAASRREGTASPRLSRSTADQIDSFCAERPSGGICRSTNLR